MPLPHFSSRLSTPKKIAATSLAAGLLIALLVSSLYTIYLHHKREQAWTLLTSDIQHYLAHYFHDLKTTADSLQPLTLADCSMVSADLTSRAAFNVNVRAFLLIRDEIAYCSSAIGTIRVPLMDLMTDIDPDKEVDMDIVKGTPMLPGKPAIAMWFRNPTDSGRGVFTILNVNLTPYLLFTARQRDITGIALVVGNEALTTFENGLRGTKDLPPEPLRTASIAGYPMQIYLYGNVWPAQDIQLSVLLGILSGLLGGVLTGYLLYTRSRSGKEILIGIKRHQFFVMYQPVVESRELRMTGVEALMRWEHPEAGMIPPDAFISFAEAQQLIVPLTRHLFKLIAADAPQLQKVLPRGAKLGVNIAPGHLHSATFKEDIRQFAASLPPDYFHIVFEITERDMIQEKEALGLFQWLHDEGFEIAVDDFGTGHSALIYLERFKLDYLKIDRGFVNAIGTETVTSPVLDAVITLAKRLNMDTVAEGVETAEQAKWLREQHVTYLQGYYFSRPLRLAQLTEGVTFSEDD
ncbi:cyclic di-GMP phosphodiesterase [Franconibacter daqui]|uniref:cyclic-guanylate-specific phosphodiesterase n=1 Tax=Franconibacter daqui TaxID=2047724 RepID=A0ABV1PKX9_9ENTR